MHIRRSRYLRYRFPPEIISHAVWLYHRYCLSFRDVEDLLAERGIIVSYETIRQWCGKFGPDYARRWCADAGRPTRFKPSSPSPTDAVRDGSAKLGHPVQNVTREHGLTPLPR